VPEQVTQNNKSQTNAQLDKQEDGQVNLAEVDDNLHVRNIATEAEGEPNSDVKSFNLSKSEFQEFKQYKAKMQSVQNLI
jgi:hypothetical protein